MSKDPGSHLPAVTAEIKLHVTPDRAGVFVDGLFVGHVGEFGGPGKAMLVAPGTRKITVFLSGYKTFETECCSCDAWRGKNACQGVQGARVDRTRKAWITGDLCGQWLRDSGGGPVQNNRAILYDQRNCWHGLGTRTGERHGGETSWRPASEKQHETRPKRQRFCDISSRLENSACFLAPLMRALDGFFCRDGRLSLTGGNG